IMSPGDAEDACTNLLNDEGHHGRLVSRMQIPYRLEEQFVLGHGVIDTRAREDEPIVAAEGRDEDSDRHYAGTGSAEHLQHDGGADTILIGVLDDTGHVGEAIHVIMQRQDHKIDEISEDIKSDDDPST